MTLGNGCGLFKPKLFLDGSPGDVPTASGMVKKKFIDPATAAHFHLVHRSQRDPKAADPEAPQRVLAALPETGNQARKSVRGTQSTRAILQEQDLEGFDEAVDDPLEAAAIHALDGINELGLPAGYDYEQHMRPMGQAGQPSPSPWP